MSTWWDDAEAPPCAVTPERAERSGLVATPYGDLRFLNVSGSLEEMAVQLATRTRDEARLGAVPAFARHLEQTFANSPVRRVAGLLGRATHGYVGKRLRRNFPAENRRALEAFARIAEIPEDDVWRAYLTPELFLWVVGTYHKILGSKRALGLGTVPSLGCTSAIATRPRADRTLHARNFDYFGLDSWDRFPTVVFYHPDDGLDHVAITTAGVIGAGGTCMNAAGLTFAVHQHFVDEFDLNGTPIAVVSDRVMRQAHSIEEAVAVLRQHPPVGGWTFVMSEGDTGRAAVYEVAPGKEHLHWLDADEAALGYANVYWGRSLETAEVDYYPEYRRCNYARQDRVLQCLAEADGAGPPDLARIIGDLVDPLTGAQRLIGPTIASVLTVGSVVFDPEHRRVWVAAGRSPTCRGWYVPFDLAGASCGPSFEVQPFLPFPGWHETPRGKAFSFYREAAALKERGEASDDKLLVLVEHALALAPDEPYLRILAGLLALRLGRGRRAEGAFRRSLEDIVRPSRRAEVGLFLAWSLDLQGQRGAAKHLYRSVLTDPHADDIVIARATYNRRFRFTNLQAGGLAIDFTYASVP